MTAQPIRTLDQLVDQHIDLSDKIAQLSEQLNGVKAQMRDLGVGDHAAKNGVVVKVTAPARRFNLERALTMLNDEQKALTLAPVAAKVKAQLSGVLVDSCMDEGTGDPVVKVVVK